MVVLEALSRSPTLETLDFSACPQAAAAWPLVPDGTWPKLKPYGVPQEELPRLHGDGASVLWFSLRLLILGPKMVYKMFWFVFYDD